MTHLFLRSDRRALFLSRLLWNTAVVASVALAGCGNKDTAAVPTQVVAKVGGEEITEMQLNAVLERQPGLKADQVEPVSRKVVTSLVDQEIVLQKARDLKLDRDQRVVQQIESLKRDAISRAYLDRIADGATKPSPAEVQTYYDENPALFKQRRVYSFQEFTVQATPAQKADIEAQLTSLKSPAELETYLKSKQLAVRTERSTVAAENVPLPMLQRVAAMSPGQGLIVPANGGLRVMLMLGAQESPVALEAARPAINAYLLNIRKRQTIEKEMAALRTGAKIEYFGKYADLAASAAAASPEASAAASAARPVAAMASSATPTRVLDASVSQQATNNPK